MEQFNNFKPVQEDAKSQVEPASEVAAGEVPKDLPVVYKGTVYKPYKDRWGEEWTVREWYSHTTAEKGAGPGYDQRAILLDEDFTQAVYGRSFKELIHDGNAGGGLPDIPLMYPESL